MRLVISEWNQFVEHQMCQLTTTGHLFIWLLPVGQFSVALVVFLYFFSFQHKALTVFWHSLLQFKRCWRRERWKIRRITGDIRCNKRCSNPNLSVFVLQWKLIFFLCVISYRPSRIFSQLKCSHNETTDRQIYNF